MSKTQKRQLEERLQTARYRRSARAGKRGGGQGRKKETKRKRTERKRGGKKRKNKRENGGGGGKKKRKREGDGFRGVEERGYGGGQDLILITLDRHEWFSVFNHLKKGQTTQTTPLIEAR